MINDPKNSAPLVAVVTPVYNGAEFLADAMESVQAQTYPNIVHVILDNASTDATPEIIAAFKNRKVPLILGHNDSLLPMDQNWNAALELIPADAAYFRVLCADDMLMPEATRRMVALAESDPTITVVSTSVQRGGKSYDVGWPNDRSVFEGDEALRRYFTNAGAIEALQVMMRRDALNSARPFFDLNVGHSSDIDAALRMLKYGRFGYVHEILCQVREHEGSTTVSEMHPLKIHFNDFLIMMRRHAREAFGAEYDDIERRYLRFYFRRLLRWRFINGDARIFAVHMDLLKRIESRPGLIDFADSFLDLILEKTGLRPAWYGYPW